MNHPRIALCSDYPMSSFTQPTATGLAQLLGHEVSRDQITRYRSGTDFSSRDGLPLAKAAPRIVETDAGAPVFNGSVRHFSL